MNLFLKWCFYVIIGSAAPIIVRAIIHYFPKKENEIALFNVTDILFYGIAIHLALFNELMRLKDCPINTLCKAVSWLAFAGYLICSVLSIVDETHIEQFVYLRYFIIGSALYCMACKGLLTPFLDPKHS